MKTKLFAIVNCLSFLLMVISLEIENVKSFLFIIIPSAALFIISGSLSIWKRQIWRTAHVNPESFTPNFYKENYKLLASILVSVVVVISIVGDFVNPVRDLSIFLSRIVIYIAIFMPCFYVIFYREPYSEVKV